MNLLSYLSRRLADRGFFDHLLPDEPSVNDEDRAKIRAEIAARRLEQRALQVKIYDSVQALRELNEKNHYGESLRRAFKGDEG